MSEPEDAADVRIDARGLRCPMPVLRAEVALRRLSAGKRLVVVADDPVATVDIPHFCSLAGHRVERLSDVGGACVFIITHGG